MTIKFFIGSSPSLAEKIISPNNPAYGVMVSVNSLRKRKTPFNVNNWILDSGAFTEVARNGGYGHKVNQYYAEICKWARCGNLLTAVAQDYMCEEFVLKRTGLDIRTHQRLTIERYDELLALNPPVPIMPVLQGQAVSDYLRHLKDYGNRLSGGMWVGVGSVCRRNGKPAEVADILEAIKLIRPDLKLHGFGLKILAFEHSKVRDNLYSADSMAWAYPKRFRKRENLEIELAHNYQNRIQEVVSSKGKKRISPTAGAGNGQGRKPKWKSKTTAIRIPQRYKLKVIELCRQWEAED